MNNNLEKLERARDILCEVWIPYSGKTEKMAIDIDKIIEGLDQRIFEYGWEVKKDEYVRLDHWIANCK